jgi:hypothetical protein
MRRFVMIYEVKVLSPKGKVKKIISRKELAAIYWNKFQNCSREITLANSRRKRTARRIEERPDVETFLQPSG